MNVTIIATKSCSHRTNLERELRELAVEYDVLYVEDAPQVVSKLGIRHSPNIVVDGRVVCRGQPSEGELKTILGLT